MVDDEYDEIQREWFESYRHKAVTLIIAQPEGFFTVYQHSAGGVAPPSDYATVEEAAARVLQMLNIKAPVVPQSWPERIEIGTIEGGR